jgi:hypothetical protein
MKPVPVPRCHWKTVAVLMLIAVATHIKEIRRQMPPGIRIALRRQINLEKIGCGGHPRPRQTINLFYSFIIPLEFSTLRSAHPLFFRTRFMLCEKASGLTRTVQRIAVQETQEHQHLNE